MRKFTHSGHNTKCSLHKVKLDVNSFLITEVKQNQTYLKWNGKDLYFPKIYRFDMLHLGNLAQISYFVNILGLEITKN